LDEFVKWARESAVVETQPVPGEAGVLYVEPRPGALELLPVGNAETLGEAWGTLQENPGRTLEGVAECIRTEKQWGVTKKRTEVANGPRANRHVSIAKEIRPGPVAEAVEAVINSNVVKNWLSSKHSKHVVVQVVHAPDCFMNFVLVQDNETGHRAGRGTRQSPTLEVTIDLAPHPPLNLFHLLAIEAERGWQHEDPSLLPVPPSQRLHRLLDRLALHRPCTAL